MAKKNDGKRVTRYTHEDASDPRTPETGHTALLPGDEEVVELDLDNGWGEGLDVARLETDRTVLVDMDPAVDPVLMWAGKRNRREIPVLPLQRNEIVSESRIAQIIARARRSSESGATRQGYLFADLEKQMREEEKDQRVEFYTHEEGWKNKMVSGDSLQVMESLVRYEGLAGKVQMIYIDPPYGVGYNSNFQQRVDIPSNDSGVSGDDVLTIKAFNDTWAIGIHSYLGHLAERLYLARQLLRDEGSVFVQISEDNVHLVRALVGEVFGEENFCGMIAFTKTAGLASDFLASSNDYLIWYAKDRSRAKYNQLYLDKVPGDPGGTQYTWVELPDGSHRQMTAPEIAKPSTIPDGARIFSHQSAYTTGSATTTDFEFAYDGRTFTLPPRQRWRTTREGMERLAELGRLFVIGNSLRYKRYLDDFPYLPLNQAWTDTSVSGFSGGKVYVVQTNEKVVGRCVLMTTDPGDLVFDPTCGSGTTALVAEQFGRRWITCDTSRVAVNVARQRLLASTFPHYVQVGSHPSGGFEYESASRITLRSLTNEQEPEALDLVDRPVVDRGAIRVCGPFEVDSVGRYSIDDWRAAVAGEGADELGSYVDTVARLYRADAEALSSASPALHAIAESEIETIGISIGPVSGRVTARQVLDAIESARELGIPSVHVLGWAFEANVGELLSGIADIDVVLVMIRPDALAEGLKVSSPDRLFSPLALPDVSVEPGSGNWSVVLDGVGLFDRERGATTYHSASSGYIAAWYLDEDYDGDCFVDCQMFFDFKKAPNLKPAVGAKIDPEEFKLSFTSEPFEPGEYRRIAVKVVDVYGNESTVVKDLD